MMEELARFVASLAIPADRKAIVLAELADHVSCAREAAVRENRDADAAERAALGELEAMRGSIEAIEPAFQISRWRAALHGIAGGAVVAVVLDRGGSLMRGVVGAFILAAIAALFAPRGALGMLRGELRASRIRGVVGRGLPIGPILTYAVTVMCVPFTIWIAMLMVRARDGIAVDEVPWTAYAVPFALFALLLVEGVRARRGTVVS